MELTPSMRRLTSSLLVATVTGSLLLCVPTDSHAAEFTDLLDAADDFDDLDEESWDPFDFNLEPVFQFQYSSGQVTREAPCVPELTTESDAVRENPRLVQGKGRCSQPRTVFNREMQFESSRAQLDLNLRAGIYKDLELRLNVPYVFSSSRRLSYDQEDPCAASTPPTPPWTRAPAPSATRTTAAASTTRPAPSSRPATPRSSTSRSSTSTLATASLSWTRLHLHAQGLR